MHLLSTGVAVSHILGVGTLDGAYDLEIRTRPRFLNNAPTHPVSSSCV